MPKITNKFYAEFKNKGTIIIIDPEILGRVLDGIKGQYALMGKAFCIVSYYSGCRPIEALSLRSIDFKREGRYLIITMPGSKRGLTRPVYINFSKPFIKELHDYAMSLPPSMYLFHKFRSNYVRTIRGKQYIVVSDKLRYYFKKWFSPIMEVTPYYLRHNRFSSLSMKGATLQDIRQLKGSKTDSSVTPYLHLSTKGAKKISKILE